MHYFDGFRTLPAKYGRLVFYICQQCIGNVIFKPYAHCDDVFGCISSKAILDVSEEYSFAFYIFCGSFRLTQLFCGSSPFIQQSRMWFRLQVKINHYLQQCLQQAECCILLIKSRYSCMEQGISIRKEHQHF